MCEGARIVRAASRKFKQIQVFRGFRRVPRQAIIGTFGVKLDKRWFSAALVAAAGVVLSACATTAVRQPSASLQPSSSLNPQSVQAVARDKDLPLKLMAAEFAVQRNDLATAAKYYAEASNLSSDVAIAEQATRLALAGKQWDLARTTLKRWQSLDPDAAGVLQSKAWIALAGDDVEAAYAALSDLAERSAINRWRPIAQVLISSDDKKRAAGLLSRLATPQRLGESDQDWVAMSQLAFKLDNKALAERLSGEAVKRFKTSDAYAWSAQLALDRDDKKGARDQFAAALKRDPESLRLRTGYAALLAESGDNAAATQALASGKQTDVVYGARAAYAVRSEDKSLLASLYREIEADKSARSSKRIYLLGQLAELVGKDAEAIDWYRQLPEGDERWFDAGMRIVVLSDKAGHASVSASKVEQLRLAVAGDSAEAIDLTLLQAQLLIEKSRKSDALQMYSEGLQQNSEEPRLLYSRAMLLIEMDDLAAGERDLRKVLAIDPDSADALNALGYTLVDRTDRLTEATALIEKAIKIKPDEPAIIDSYGWAQYRLGNLEEAVKLLRKAYSRQPDSEVAAHLGEVLWVSGKQEEARRIWAQGRKKDADNKILIETMKRLTS